MADSTTVGPGFTKPEVGGSDSTWGGKLNANFDSQAAELTKTYAGNPNGFVAGVYVGQTLWDSTNQIRWCCKTAGSAGGAVWREVGGLPAGTRKIWPQILSAPPDWSIDASSMFNNAALRFANTGSQASGGSLDFSAAFASGRTSNSTVLTQSQMPAHTHTQPAHFHGYSDWPTGAANVGGIQSAVGSGNTVGQSGNAASTNNASPNSTGAAGGESTGTAGSSGGHDHGLPSFAVKFVDATVCQHA